MRLTPNLRRMLSTPHRHWVVEVFEGPREVVAQLLRTLIHSARRIYVVGDYVCETLTRFVGYVPSLCVVDGATLREKRGRYVDPELFDEVLECSNPRSCISLECIQALRRALSSGVRTLVAVHGEEDLLALPLIAMALEGLVLFGMPGRGVGAIDVVENRVLSINALSMFEGYPEVAAALYTK